MQCLIWYDRPVLALYAGREVTILAWLVEEIKTPDGKRDALAGAGLDGDPGRAFREGRLNLGALLDSGAPLYHLRPFPSGVFAWRVPDLPRPHHPDRTMLWTDILAMADAGAA